MMIISSSTGSLPPLDKSWVWIALDELRTLIPDLSDNIVQRLEANEGPGTFYDDRNYPLRDHAVYKREANSEMGLHDSMKSLESMLRAISPSSVVEDSIEDPKHDIEERSVNKELAAALETMEELADVEEASDVVIGLGLAIMGVEKANEALEDDGLLEALNKLDKVGKTLMMMMSGDNERVKRSSDDDNRVHKAFVEDNQNKVYRKNFTEAQYDWLLDQFDLSRDEVDGLQVLTDDKLDEMLARVETEAATSDSNTIWELLELLRGLPRDLIPEEVEAAGYGALGMTSHIVGRIRQGLEPSAQMVRDKILPQMVDSVPEDVREWAGQGSTIAARRAKLVADYTSPKLADLYDTVDELQLRIRQSAVETVDEVGPKVMPTLLNLAEELRQTISVAQEMIPTMVERVGDGMENLMSSTKPIKGPEYGSVVDPVPRREWKQQERVESVLQDVNKFYSDSVEMVGDYYEGTVEPAFGTLSVKSGEVLRKQIIPSVEQMGDTVKDNAPMAKELMKKTLDGVFTGVPHLVQKLSHEAHDAAKVFNRKYSAALNKMKSSEDHPSEAPITKAPPTSLKRPSKAPIMKYSTSTEL